jgi:hypothetical protein
VKRTFQNKPMTFHESLHWCGCPSCQADIAYRAQTEPPQKPDFLAYLREEYPETAGLMEVSVAAETGSPGTPEGVNPTILPQTEKGS